MKVLLKQMLLSRENWFLKPHLPFLSPSGTCNDIKELLTLHDPHTKERLALTHDHKTDGNVVMNGSHVGELPAAQAIIDKYTFNRIYKQDIC